MWLLLATKRGRKRSAYWHNRRVSFISFQLNINICHLFFTAHQYSLSSFYLMMVHHLNGHFMQWIYTFDAFITLHKGKMMRTINLKNVSSHLRSEGDKWRTIVLIKHTSLCQPIIWIRITAYNLFNIVSLHSIKNFVLRIQKQKWTYLMFGMKLFPWTVNEISNCTFSGVAKLKRSIRRFDEYKPFFFSYCKKPELNSNWNGFYQRHCGCSLVYYIICNCVERILQKSRFDFFSATL